MNKKEIFINCLSTCRTSINLLHLYSYSATEWEALSKISSWNKVDHILSHSNSCQRVLQYTRRLQPSKVTSLVSLFMLCFHNLYSTIKLSTSCKVAYMKSVATRGPEAFSLVLFSRPPGWFETMSWISIQVHLVLRVVHGSSSENK